MRAGLSIVLSILFFCNLNAQVANEADFKKKFALVDGYLFDGDYIKALPISKELYNYDSTNANVAYMLGTSYLGADPDRKIAIRYLEQAVGNVSLMYKEGDYKEKTAPGITYYNLAKAYHFAYRFDDAISNFYNYRSFIDLEDAKTYNEVKRQIEYSENAKLLIEQPVNIKVQSLGPVINSQYEDYSPVISADGNTLVFTSRREGSTGGKLFYDGKYFEDIYISKKENGKWITPRSIGENINTDGHEATIGLSPDGQELFIYKDDNNDGNIYMSRLNGSEWSKPEKLGGEINTTAWETHATVSADGLNLFFVSNRKGGIGGRDIYKVSRLPNGEWGKAENLGPTINTEFEEEAPFFAADGKTLIFSSQGHNSMGGFDIFTSENIDGVWSTPVNIGYPINTPEDDIFFITTPDGHFAYYSSRMEGGMGGKDIYLIELEDKKKESLTVMKGKLIVENSPEINANIVVSDARTSAVTGIYKPNTKTGSYIFILQPGAEYNVSYECEGYESKVDKIVVPLNSSYSEITKAIILDPVVCGSSQALIAYEEQKKKEEVEKVEENNITENDQLAKEVKALEEQLLSQEKALKEEEEAKLAAAKKAEEDAKLKSIEEKRLAEEADTKAKAEEASRLAEEQRRTAEAAKLKAEEDAKLAAAKKAEEDAKQRTAEEKRIAEEAAAKAAEAARLKAEEESKLAAAKKAEEEKRIAEEAAAKARAEEAARLAEEQRKAEEAAKLKAEEEAKLAAARKAEEEKRIAEEAAAKAKAEEAARLAEEKRKAEEKERQIAEQKKKMFEDSLIARKNAILQRLEELKKAQAQKLEKEKEEMASGFAKNANEEKKKEEERKALEEKRIAEEKLAADKRAAEEASKKAKMEELRRAEEKAAEERRKAEEAAAKAKAEEDAKIETEALANSKSIEELKKMNQELIKENELLKKQIAESNKKIDQLNSQVEEQNNKYEELLAKFEEIQKQQKYQAAVNNTDFESFKKGEAVVLKNILFDYNLSIFNKKSEGELQKLYVFMRDNKDVKIEVSGHTDSHGNDEYNIELSKDRANAVIRYLTALGIDGKRFKSVGMGERQPIAINENPDGSDNPEGRKLNRRIEIKILNPEGKAVKVEDIKVPSDLKPKS